MNKPHEGMPQLAPAKTPISFFEFWPAKLFYAPIVIYILFLMLRYRSITLPLLANPNFTGGGFVGESKADILNLLQQHIPTEFLADFIIHTRQAPDNLTTETADLLHKLTKAQLSLPIVAKPDLGCRGAGVRLLRTMNDLETYLTDFPRNERIIFQRYVDYEGEAGVFYIRDPQKETGQIFSLTLKYFPYVYGDGKKTLKELILADERAGKVPQLYLKRFADKLSSVPDNGQAVRLVFSGSHSKGAIFRDGSAFITPQMTDFINSLATQIPGFYFGRFDIRFKDIASLQQGKDLKILELNGAGAEATHIWDSSTSLLNAWRTLMVQYKWLFVIGHQNRLRGAKLVPFAQIYTMYKKEQALVALYPITH